MAGLEGSAVTVKIWGVTVDGFMSAFAEFAEGILELLPTSPTIDNEALETLRLFSGYINYFIPVGPYMTFLGGVLVCLAIYYGARVLLRWLKVIA